MNDALDSTSDLAGLERSLKRIERVSALDSDTLLTKSDSISAWSPGDHAFHVILACDLSLRNARSLVLDRGRLVREPEDRKDEALTILHRGRIPRGKAQAPRFVTPPARLDLDLLRTLTDEVQTARAELAKDVAQLEKAPRTVPHQLLGDLTAQEWVRFARLHTAHHLVILRELLRAQTN